MKPPYLLILRPRSQDPNASSLATINAELVAVFSIEDRAAVKDHSPAIFSFLEECLAKYRNMLKWKAAEIRESDTAMILPASHGLDTEEKERYVSSSPSATPSS